MSVVDAVAVDAVVLVAQANDCSDRGRVEAALAASLGGARAPRRGPLAGGRWRLVVKVASVGAQVKVADARILADDGSMVAERSVSDRTNGSCGPLVRAVGAWAQIVLDDELVRAHEVAAPEPAQPGARGDARSSARGDAGRGEGRRPVRSESRTEGGPEARGEDARSGERIEGDGDRLRGGDRSRAADAASTDDTASTSTSTGTSTSARERTEGSTALGGIEALELGVMGFVRSRGPERNGIVGASPFMTFGLTPSWVLRPALALGGSAASALDGSKPSLLYLAGRVDLCRRMPGNYIERRGIELDACAGADVGWTSTKEEKAVLASVGPSAILRGEISSFGLEIRAMAGVGNSDRGAPIFVASGELGGSMRFR